MTIESCIFENSVDFNQSTIIKGYFMQIISRSNVYVDQSIFLGGNAMLGGAIYMVGDASLFITDSTFTENNATRQGGAICADSFVDIQISN